MYDHIGATLCFTLAGLSLLFILIHAIRGGRPKPQPHRGTGIIPWFDDVDEQCRCHPDDDCWHRRA